MAITGAPRIVKGKVLIGAAGSEYFSRGYLAAFDAETGKEAWRFTRCPATRRNRSKASIWQRRRRPGAVSTGNAAAAARCGIRSRTTLKKHLVYFGTANAEPWVPSIRNTTEGDNLYGVDRRDPARHRRIHLALQETPEDRWDFDSDQQIIAANIAVGGKTQRVVMHAPKNGFFYVLDAKTGKSSRVRRLRPSIGRRASIQSPAART